MPAAQAQNTLPEKASKDEGAIQVQATVADPKLKRETAIRFRGLGVLAIIVLVGYFFVQQHRSRIRESHKIHPYWGRPSLDSESCIAYNTRRYNARLWNVPLTFDWRTVCMTIPIKIHNRKMTVPERCEIRVSSSPLSVLTRRLIRRPPKGRLRLWDLDS